MNHCYRLAQINFARLRVPLSDPRMARFIIFLQGVNTLAEASPGFVWRMDELSAAASGDRLFPNQPAGTTLVNLSVWKSVGALHRYASLGMDAGIANARQLFFNRFEGRWVALWWVPDGHFPEVADGWARLRHLRRQRATPYAFNLGEPYPPPPGAQDYLPIPTASPSSMPQSSSVPANPSLPAPQLAGPWEKW